MTTWVSSQEKKRRGLFLTSQMYIYEAESARVRLFCWRLNSTACSADAPAISPASHALWHCTARLHLINAATTPHKWHNPLQLHLLCSRRRKSAGRTLKKPNKQIACCHGSSSFAGDIGIHQVQVWCPAGGFETRLVVEGLRELNDLSRSIFWPTLYQESCLFQWIDVGVTVHLHGCT